MNSPAEQDPTVSVAVKKNWDRIMFSLVPKIYIYFFAGYGMAKFAGL